MWYVSHHLNISITKDNSFQTFYYLRFDIYTCYCGTQMVFIFSIEILADIEVMPSISNINRVIEETLVFYVICVTPSNYFYN